MNILEQVAESIHGSWMQNKRSLGITTFISTETGENLMVDYADLSETAKESERAEVRAVIAALTSAVDAETVTV